MVAVPIATGRTPAQLRALARRERDGRVSARLLALANALDGMSRGAAARAAGMDRQTLRDWVHRYNAAGVAGLRDRPRAGRPCRLDEGRQATLKALILRGPKLSSFGDDGARWGAALMVESRHGVVDGGVEVIGAAEGAVGEVVALQVAPRALDVVQLGGVPGQPLDPEPRPRGEGFRAGLAGVDRPVVEHQYHRPARLIRLRRVVPVEPAEEA